MTTHQWTRERHVIVPCWHTTGQFRHSFVVSNHRALSPRNWLTLAVTGYLSTPAHARSRNIYGLNSLRMRFTVRALPLLFTIAIGCGITARYRTLSYSSSLDSMPVITRNWSTPPGRHDLMEFENVIAEAAQISEQVQDALAYLTAYGTGNEPVWVMLWLNEIVGCGYQVCCCPVARLIQQWVPLGDVRVYDDCVTVRWGEGYLLTERLPEPVRRFIAQFDDGAYPLLVDYNHRHGLLPIQHTS